MARTKNPRSGTLFHQYQNKWILELVNYSLKEIDDFKKEYPSVVFAGEGENVNIVMYSIKLKNKALAKSLAKKLNLAFDD